LDDNAPCAKIEQVSDTYIAELLRLHGELRGLSAIVWLAIISCWAAVGRMKFVTRRNVWARPNGATTLLLLLDPRFLAGGVRGRYLEQKMIVHSV